MENILCSDVAWEIRLKNIKYCEDKIEEIRIATNKINDNANESEKQDEAMFMLCYYRKWNDIVVVWKDVNFFHSSLSSYDIANVRNIINNEAVKFYNPGE